MPFTPGAGSDFEVRDEVTLRRSSDFIQEILNFIQDSGLSHELMPIIKTLKINSQYQNCFQVRRLPFKIYIIDLKAAFALIDLFSSIVYKLLNRIVSDIFTKDIPSGKYRLIFELNRWQLYLNLIHGELAHVVAENSTLTMWLPTLSSKDLRNAELYLKTPVNRSAEFLTTIWRALIKKFKYRDRSNGIQSCYYFESALMRIMSRPIGSYIATKLLSCLADKDIEVTSTESELKVYEEGIGCQKRYSINIPSGSLRQPYNNLAIHGGYDLTLSRSEHSGVKLIGFIVPDFIAVAHELLHFIEFSERSLVRTGALVRDRLTKEQWSNIEELKVINRMVGCENAVSFFDYHLPIRITHESDELRNFDRSKANDSKTMEYWMATAISDFNQRLPEHLKIKNLLPPSCGDTIVRREMLSENSFNQKLRQKRSATSPISE